MGQGRIAPPPPKIPALCFQCLLMHPARYATVWHPVLMNHVRLLMHLECLTSCDDFWTLTYFVQFWVSIMMYNCIEQAFSLDYFKFVQS